MNKSDDDADANRGEARDASSARAKPDSAGAVNLSQIMKIPIDVKFVLACARLSVEELMQITPGSKINTSAHLDDKIDIVANGRVVARGEMVVVNEETSQIGIMVTEVVGSGNKTPGS